MPPMQRNRGLNEEIRASTYQCHPCHLLYRLADGWCDGDVGRAAARIAALMPLELRQGWDIIRRGMITRDTEHLAIGAARWICDHGRLLGFRTPDVNERARVTGCAHYLMSLGLEEDQLFDAQGNHFDPAALLVRIARPITGWLRGGPLAHTHLP